MGLRGHCRRHPLRLFHQVRLHLRPHLRHRPRQRKTPVETPGRKHQPHNHRHLRGATVLRRCGGDQGAAASRPGRQTRPTPHPQGSRAHRRRESHQECRCPTRLLSRRPHRQAHMEPPPRGQRLRTHQPRRRRTDRHGQQGRPSLLRRVHRRPLLAQLLRRRIRQEDSRGPRRAHRPDPLGQGHRLPPQAADRRRYPHRRALGLRPAHRADQDAQGPAHGTRVPLAVRQARPPLRLRGRLSHHALLPLLLDRLLRPRGRLRHGPFRRPEARLLDQRHPRQWPGPGARGQRRVHVSIPADVHRGLSAPQGRLRLGTG